MIEVDIRRKKEVRIHIEHSDDELFNTIGLTFHDVKKSSELHKHMLDIKAIGKHDNMSDIVLGGENMSIYGHGWFRKVEWKANYPSETYGIMKVSFRCSEYRMVKGKAMIRNTKLTDILSEA